MKIEQLMEVLDSYLEAREQVNFAVRENMDDDEDYENFRHWKACKEQQASRLAALMNLEVE